MTILGDPTPTLIEYFVPRVEEIVSTFVWKNPHFRGIKDDLISVGHLKMVTFLTDLEREKFDNLAHLSNYLRRCIITGLTDFVRANTTIKAPRNKWLVTNSLTTDPVDPSTDRNGAITAESLLDACQDGSDTMIITLMLDGMGKKGIAEFLKISQAAVVAKAKEILYRARYVGN